MSPAGERGTQDRWLGVEVRHLAALKAVASEGSFGAAALSLGYAQSAISQQVAALERHVGRRLFDRPGGSRPVTLTRAGELLLEHADSILGRLAAARVDLESLDHDDETQGLKVGAPQTLASTILPRILRNLGAAPSEIGLEVTQASDDRELVALLEQGQLDVAFIELPVAGGSIEFEALATDPLVLLVDAEHPYVDLDRPVTPAEIATVPLILSKCEPMATRLRDLFAGQGLTLNVVHTVEDVSTAHGFVTAGLGSALVPRLAALSLPSSLAAVTVDDSIPVRTLAVAWHRDRLRTCTAGLFVDLALEAAGELTPRL
ncbi:MAG: LysR family transcriptional regulator [Gaiellales bacterium]